LAASFGRFGILRHLTWAKKFLRASPTQVRDAATESAFALPESSEGGSEFEPDWLEVRMSAISRSLSRLSSRRRIVQARRRHYLALHAALRELPGSEPLFPALPDGVVPYVYPLVVFDEQSVFPTLKHAGVPIFRWELANRDDCETSAWYSRHLLQFPCHQELTNSEVDWMIDQVRRALSL
jgi:dTDP-4-amino-4,6-dideoxygalactose transaminase